MTLKVTQLKPNPSGKDVTFHGALAGQLAGEWVDIANDGVRPFDLRRLNFYHRAYSSRSTWAWALVIDPGASFQDELHPGQILRIHSGRVREIDVIRPADRVGADRHGFTGRDSYIWNNANADEAAILEPAQRVFLDRAEYAPFPSEGVVLVRIGNALVPGLTQGVFAGLASLGGLR